METKNGNGPAGGRGAPSCIYKHASQVAGWNIARAMPLPYPAKNQQSTKDSYQYNFQKITRTLGSKQTLDNSKDTKFQINVAEIAKPQKRQSYFVCWCSSSSMMELNFTILARSKANADVVNGG